MNQTGITIVGRFAAVPLCLHAGARFRMLVEEMTQRHDQFLRMPDTTGVERPVNVINDHSPDRFPAVYPRRNLTIR